MDKILRYITSYLFPIPFLFLCLYIFFMYNAQETLLPTQIHSIVMYAMVGLTFAYSFVKGNLRFTNFTKWYILFLLFCCVSVMFCAYNVQEILYPCVVSLIISYCYLQNINSTDKIKSICLWYVIAALFMGLQLWASGQLQYFLNVSNTEVGRLGEDFMSNVNVFANMFMYAGVFSAWGAIYSKSKVARQLYWISLAVILFFMILSGGRKTIVAVLASTAIMIILKKQYKGKKISLTSIIIAILIVVAFFIVIFNVPFLYDYIGVRFEGLFELLSGNEADVSGDDLRKRMIFLALEGWIKEPIWGHGIDSFKFFNMQRTSHFFYSHNTFVELLYDLGIIGTICYFWMYVYIYKNLKLVPSQFQKYKALGYGILVELLIFDMGGVSYYLSTHIVLLSIAYICAQFRDYTSPYQFELR